MAAVRSRTRRAGAAALLALLLTGCGGHSTSGATPTSGPTPTSTSTPPDVPVIPADFPLAEGLVADGDTTVSAPRHGAKGIRLEPTCWGRSWPGPAVDRLVVQQVGPELGVTRELAVYPDAATAAAVARAVRAKAALCHRLPATSDGPALDVTSYGGAGSGSAHSASFAETLAGGQPGGSVFAFTRVGRAVLAVQDSGEWTRDSADDGVRHLTRRDRAVIARLCVFTTPGC